MNFTKLSLLLSLPALICSCGSDEEQLQTPPVSQEREASVFRVTPKEAAAAVTDFLSEQPAQQVRGTQVQDDREVDAVIDLEGARRTRGATTLTDSVTKNFYFVTLKGGRGYAVVSKDKRTFPIFAVLDEGTFSPDSLNSAYMQYRLGQAQEGQKAEIAYFDRMWKEYEEGQGKATRASMDEGKSDINTPKVSLEGLVAMGWTKIREAKPKLTHVKWGQDISNKGFVCMKGVPYADRENSKEVAKYMTYEANKFGCTSVAYGQVLYALRNYPGFKDLKYTNGERVRWEDMSDSDYKGRKECQRFLGWITANCSPQNVGGQTMIFNATAKDFVRKILKGYIEYRYDNCIVGEGDFDGYGWSEDKRVAVDYFTHPDKCFVIMTGGASVADGIFKQFDLRYHTYVIDGMAEFNKRESYRQLFWKKWSTTVRRMYHVNAGWEGRNNGYYLYVDSKRGFEYNGKFHCMDYRSRVSYFVMYPKD